MRDNATLHLDTN